MASTVTDAYNAVIGTMVACLTMFFGEHWFIFALFLFLNLVDYITGIMKARINQKVSSMIGLKGVVKKLGYWVMIAFSFMLSQGFMELGKMIDVDLGFSPLIGWFVVASLTVNEARSICENFVEAGYDVPKVLIRGLEVADALVNKEKKDS
ncbi:MAG: holin family protein [Coprobacillaceae bacterium]